MATQPSLATTRKTPSPPPLQQSGTRSAPGLVGAPLRISELTWGLRREMGCYSKREKKTLFLEVSKHIAWPKAKQVEWSREGSQQSERQGELGSGFAVARPPP